LLHKETQGNEPANNLSRRDDNGAGTSGNVISVAISHAKGSGYNDPKKLRLLHNESINKP